MTNISQSEMQLSWPDIRRHFSLSFKSNLHFAVASVNEANNVTVTPVGSMFLNDDMTGFYFEKFVSNLPKSAKVNPQICVLGVNSNRWFWLKSLVQMKFNKHPALKLYGTLGELRPATPEEKARFERRTRLTKYFKGHKYLWTGMHHVREIQFTHFEQMHLGKMSM